jgi:hypothetical protein
MRHPLSYALGDDSTDATSVTIQPASGVAAASPTSAQTFLSTYQMQADYYQGLLNQAFMANVGAQADTYAANFQNTVIGSQWVSAITQCASYLATVYPNQTLYQTISTYLFTNPGFLSTAYQAANWATFLTVQSVFQFLSSMQSSTSVAFPLLTDNFYTTDVPYMLNILTPVASGAYGSYSGVQTTSQNNVNTNSALENITIEIQQWIASTNPQAAAYGITPVQLTDMIANAQANASSPAATNAPTAAVAITSAPTSAPVSSSIVTSSNATSQIPASVPATGVLAPVPSVPISQAPPASLISVSALSTQTPDPTTQAIMQAAALAPVSIPLSQAVSATNTFTAGLMNLAPIPASQSNPNLPYYIAGGILALILLRKI